MGPAGLVTTAAVIAVFLVAALVFALLRKGFDTRHEAVEEAWRQVHVELVQRQDMAGRLIEVTRGRCDREVLVQARAHAVAARGAGPAAQGLAEARLTGALGAFFRAADAHPDLVADNEFRFLRWQLAEGDRRIAAGLHAYNARAQACNARFGTFPAKFGKGRNSPAQLYP